MIAFVVFVLFAWFIMARFQPASSERAAEALADGNATGCFGEFALFALVVIVCLGVIYAMAANTGGM